jgi:hypothetical protein
LCSAVAQHSIPINPFQARYTVYAKGIPIGEAIMSLEDQGQGRYAMRSDIRPTGVAALVSSQAVHERADGRFLNETIESLRYEQKRQGKKSRTLTLDFDWQNGTLQTRKNGKEDSVALVAGVVDPLSLYLQAMLDLRRGKNVTQYRVASDDRLKTYRVRRHGDEIMKTPLGSLQTLRISRQRQGSDKVTTLWFAPALGYFPVQVAQSEDGKETLRLTLEAVQGL